MIAEKRRPFASHNLDILENLVPLSTVVADPLAFPNSYQRAPFFADEILALHAADSSETNMTNRLKMQTHSTIKKYHVHL